MNKSLFYALTLALFVAASPAAMAADHDELRALESAKLSLVDAISAAEKHHNGGRALEAGIDDDRQTPVFDVTVAKDGRFYDVEVNGLTGEIISSREE